MAALPHPLRHSPPTAQEASLARVSASRLSKYLGGRKPLIVKVVEAGNEQPIELPAGAVALLIDALGTMATGRGVTLVPDDTELTTFEAAELLNVSRPYLIKLLDQKIIPCRRVGKHRRISIDDVVNYKRRIDAEREKVLTQLTIEAQENEMGYGRR